MQTKYLNAYSYIELIDIADWLKIKPAILNLETQVQAGATIQDLTFTANRLYGASGNLISIEYIDDSTIKEGEEIIQVHGFDIKVKINSTKTKAIDIFNAFKNNQLASNLVNCIINGAETNLQVGQPKTFLSGGVDSSLYDSRLYRVLVDLINSSCNKVESYINTAVICREFTEFYDGNYSNVIKPHHFPVRKVLDLRIDYNRKFTDASKLEEVNYFLRGFQDINFDLNNFEIKIIGTDIVLRDDNERFVLGRLFSGSVLGSIKLRYLAGWALNINDVPSDIQLATKMMVEFFYYQRENRDIGIASKGVKGESYSKPKDTIPKQIYELLDPYIDISLGTKPVPQRNYFGL
jgi:hypothetical protein